MLVEKRHYRAARPHPARSLLGHDGSATNVGAQDLVKDIEIQLGQRR